MYGQIVNSYGRREIPFVDRKSPFVQLLEAVHNVPGIQRIRFTSPHPCGFKRDLIEAYGRLPKLCPYVHLPLQSGSNTILKRMNRPYTRERYSRLVDELKSAVPDLYLSTDIIVGFPGETEADFEQTRFLFQRVSFDMAFIFKYSARSDTPAATLAEQVSQAVKEQRNTILLDLLQQSSLRRNQSLVGTTQDVLVEGPARRGAGRLQGRTPGNRKVVFVGSDRLTGETVPVPIERASVSTLYGKGVPH